MIFPLIYGGILEEDFRRRYHLAVGNSVGYKSALPLEGTGQGHYQPFFLKVDIWQEMK